MEHTNRMEDLDGNKSKSTLLDVFEQLSQRIKEESDPYSFRNKRGADSDASSNCDLDKEDETDLVEIKKKNKGIRLGEEPLRLGCKWNTCTAFFADYKDFVDHINNHILDITNKGETTCLWQGCSYPASSLMMLTKHVCFHGYHLKLRNIGENVLERVKLPKCINTTQFKVLDTDYNCEWGTCGKTFSTVQDFYDHIKLHLNFRPKYCKKGEFIACEWSGCKLKFTSQYKLVDHMRSHTKEKVIACPTCGKMFSTKTKFYDHRKRQLPVELQSYQCAQCSRLFPSDRLLRDHKRNHINPYKCSMCDMACPKPSILAQHIKYRHLDERPYKCNVCEHSCVTKSNLKQHLMKHNAEKPMRCDKCNYRCRSQYGLQSHYQSVHEQGRIQIYECHLCQSRFSRGNNLSRHLIKTHGCRWPSGYSRFRFKEDNDGIFRLKTADCTSLEDTQQRISPSADRPPILSEMKEEEEDLKMPSNVVMVCEISEESIVCETDEKIAITINDFDETGNIIENDIIGALGSDIL